MGVLIGLVLAVLDTVGYANLDTGLVSAKEKEFRILRMVFFKLKDM